MRGKVLLTVMALFVGFGASAQSLNAEFEREIKAKSQGITSIVAEMTQTREVAVLADVVTKEGDFRFNEPCNILL